MFLDCGLKKKKTVVSWSVCNIQMLTVFHVKWLPKLKLYALNTYL